MGRRKIEMKLVTDSGTRQVTFSKRRTGLFKKANELATLCAAQVAILIFSPGGKPYSFGHPNVESIICRFERSEISSLESTEGGSNSDLEIDGNTQKLINLLKRFHAEKKKRGKTLEKPMKARMQKHENWQKGSLGMLRDKLKSRIADLDASNSLLSLAKGF